MAEFTPITTQEQFDAMISERLKRERETLSRKYGDYDELKSRVTDYEKQLGDMSRSMEEQSRKYAGYDKTLEELRAQVKGYETHSVKMRIAHETGIPYELAGRLSGETEEDIRRDAEGLSRFIGSPTPAAPLKSTEPAVGDARTAALRSLTTQLTSKGE